MRVNLCSQLILDKFESRAFELECAQQNTTKLEFARRRLPVGRGIGGACFKNSVAVQEAVASTALGGAWLQPLQPEVGNLHFAFNSTKDLSLTTISPLLSNRHFQSEGKTRGGKDWFAQK